MFSKLKSIYLMTSEKINRLLNSKWINYTAFLLGSMFVATLFFTISKWTPLAGDDWGYALNGINGNPWTMAMSFYQTWSGRFFSELWGFIVAPNKALWNVLNPLLFISIFVFSMLLVASKKNCIVSGLLIIMLMLRVSGDLRMETYTWIMGSTYVVPLMLMLIYLYIVERKVIHNKTIKAKWSLVFTSVICFYIGLTMENVAIIMLLAQILMLIYYFYYQHRINLFLAINMLISTISFLLMRLSPGSTFRLIRDHAVWNEQSIIDKIGNNIPNFIKYTFVDNRYLIFALSSILIILLLKNIIKKQKFKKHYLSIAFILYLVSSLIIIGANKLVNDLNISIMKPFLEIDNIIVWVYWLVYIIIVLAIVYLFIEHTKIKHKIIFFIMLGGSANLVMLMSPIFGARSSLYFVYFIIIVIVLLFNELKLDGVITTFVSITLLFLIYLSTKDYVLKYSQVNLVHQERLSIIAYYLDNPEIKEIHIPRMPPYSIHGADIELGDDYHFETFKEYYGLGKDTNIVFEWKDSYN